MITDGLVAIPRAAIQDLIGGLSGFQCYWDGEGMSYDTTYISLNVLAYRTLGVDEYRTCYDSAQDQELTNLCGVRAFTLSIQVDSYDMAEPGYEILERIRRRLRGGAARLVLMETGLAVTKMTNPITDMKAIADNRPVYRAVWDVGMTFAVNEIDVTPLGGGDVIEGVTVGVSVTGTQTHDPLAVEVDVGTTS